VVPASIQNLLVLQVMKQLSKEFLENGEMDFMEGRVARLHIKDMDISYYFTLQNQALVILPNGHSSPHEKAPDPQVTFSATLDAFVLLASQKVDPDTLFFNRSLQISGDTELGLEIKNLIDQFDIQLLHKPIGHALNVWSQQLLENQHV
jgi:predicted lipid carrier protein YhbT